MGKREGGEKGKEKKNTGRNKERNFLNF